MDKKEKQDIARLVENALFLLEKDPQAFWIAISNTDILKIRANMAGELAQKEAG